MTTTLPGFTAEVALSSRARMHRGVRRHDSRDPSGLFSPAYISCGDHVCTCTAWTAASRCSRALLHRRARRLRDGRDRPDLRLRL